jgi:localization factor PodJL
MLGLDQLNLNEPELHRTVPSQPSIDSLRARSFSGLDSFLEHEEPKAGGRRILLLVVLLAALGLAGWWTYTNYQGATQGRKLNASRATADEISTEQPVAKPVAPDTPSPEPAASQPVTPAGAASAGAADGANAPADTTTKPAGPEPKPAPAAKRVIAEKPAPTPETTAKSNSVATTVRASKLPASEVADTGDADFRKAEGYLYGRGAAENCDEAVKYLKAASARSNAKARSAFGTMYATGHCVPRDLPTSYLWFALALRVDPNNQILEKDLNAVWNQMTPPERQLATRMKQ